MATHGNISVSTVDKQEQTEIPTKALPDFISLKTAKRHIALRCPRNRKNIACKSKRKPSKFYFSKRSRKNR